MFKKPFSFDGRIGRAKYFFSYAPSWTTLLGLHFATFTIRWGILFVFAGCVPLIWFMLAQGVKDATTRIIADGFSSSPGSFFG
jgi:hypothetical protein